MLFIDCHCFDVYTALKDERMNFSPKISLKNTESHLSVCTLTGKLPTVKTTQLAYLLSKTYLYLLMSMQSINQRLRLFCSNPNVIYWIVLTPVVMFAEYKNSQKVWDSNKIFLWLNYSGLIWTTQPPHSFLFIGDWLGVNWKHFWMDLVSSTFKQSIISQEHPHSNLSAKKTNHRV